eukprot:3689384-Rhodomonas_salina.2
MQPTSARHSRASSAHCSQMRSEPSPGNWSVTPSQPQLPPGTQLFPPTQQPLLPPLLPTTEATLAIHHQLPSINSLIQPLVLLSQPELVFLLQLRLHPPSALSALWFLLMLLSSEQTSPTPWTLPASSATTASEPPSTSTPQSLHKFYQQLNLRGMCRGFGHVAWCCPSSAVAILKEPYPGWTASG